MKFKKLYYKSLFYNKLINDAFHSISITHN